MTQLHRRSTDAPGSVPRPWGRTSARRAARRETLVREADDRIRQLAQQAGGPAPRLPDALPAAGLDPARPA